VPPMGSNNAVKDWPLAENEMKMRLKYRVKKPSNKGTSKKNNSGQSGRKAKALKRSRVVHSRNSPEQYGRWAALMKANNEPILG
jgi:hypothetical protein